MRRRAMGVQTCLAAALWFAGFVPVRAAPQDDTSSRHSAANSTTAGFIQRFCADCHNNTEKTADLALEATQLEDIGSHAAVWEKVVRKLRARQMPPPEMPRPDERTYQDVLSSLESQLDRAAAEDPNPGRTEGLRRLNRTQYQNAIRDLLDLEIDAAALLPPDDSSHGFDNVTVADLSPTLLDRYITAAQKISRIAVGGSFRSPVGDTFRIRPDMIQEEHVEGLPLGTRGGARITYTFPTDGEYEVQLRLARDRNEEIEGLTEPHELELLLDRERVHVFKIAPPPDKNFSVVDANLKIRTFVKAGRHQLGVTFVKLPSSLLETKRQPFHAHFNMHRHPRITPALYQVSITGPYAATGAGDTLSRRRVFVCRPASSDEELACAERILSTVMRRAYRRLVTAEDLQKPLEFYRAAREEADFDAGIEAGLSAILVSPHFLFHIEQDPPDVAANTTYRISDVELASRLSFFLWSSIPDDELLESAIRGELSQPEVLKQQVRRMLADPKSKSLATNFASQWLHLRNLESITPDLRLFPDFDDNLRQAFRQETELFFESIVREDRSVLELLKADFTFVNERLAKHYRIPHIYGSRFRCIKVDEQSQRGGLLRHGSILTVTSYATRTSPVIRGKWVLENILGLPPPPPPPDVPTLDDNSVSALLSVRERLAEHRANAACASCHNLIDPVGFALENFDAVGRWRTFEDGRPVDSAGGLPDGSTLKGVSELEQGLLRRPELFVGTLTEKLLTYALGRGVEPFDAPAVRQIVRESQAENFRFSALVVAIASSTPFQMRRSHPQ